MLVVADLCLVEMVINMTSPHHQAQMVRAHSALDTVLALLHGVGESLVRYH
jgi:hypothetical protein